MGASKDFSTQSSAPTTIAPDRVKLYADSNSVICSIVSGGAPVQLGTEYTGKYTNTQVKTGTATYINTGIWFGTAAGATLQTGLSTPAVWLPVTFNGVQYAIPGYSLQ